MTALPPEIDWRVSPGPTDYAAALAAMETQADAIRAGQGRERIWLLEHPPVYTAGTSAAADELLDARFPVVATGRGGRYTYHGPGQRIVYAMLDLSARGRDVRGYVHALESWTIRALATLGVEAWRAEGRVGIWTLDRGQEAKIGAIGVRVRRWVTLHGMAINVAPDLTHFGGIVPCGLADYAVTSLRALGIEATMADLDRALAETAGDFVQRLGGKRENPLESTTLVD